MPDLITILAVFLIGILASTFGSMVGGGTLLSLPFLMIIGLPPQIAIATERFGGLGQTLAAFYKFSRSQKINWEYVPRLSAVSSMGSIIGAQILVNINPTLLQHATAFILLTLLPLLFLNHDLGIQHQQVSKTKIIIGSVIYFLIQIFASFFGGGTGILIVHTLMIFFGLTIIEATATKIIPWFFLSLFSLLIFAQHGIINYQLGVILLAGMTIGGYFDAHLAIKKRGKMGQKTILFVNGSVNHQVAFF